MPLFARIVGGDGAFSLLPSRSLNLTKLRIQRDLNAF